MLKWHTIENLDLSLQCVCLMPLINGCISDVLCLSVVPTSLANCGDTSDPDHTTVAAPAISAGCRGSAATSSTTKRFPDSPPCWKARRHSLPKKFNFFSLAQNLNSATGGVFIPVLLFVGLNFCWWY
jgi:hypothetical protein